MKRIWGAALCVAIVAGVAGLSTAASAQSGSETPKATDVGITDKEIHIAVVADVDNTIVPNLFKASKDAVDGVGKYLNSKAGGGGLAGRKVVVDFYDSKLNPNATTNAEIQACQNDVAMVGTSSVFLTSVDNMRNCKDSTGAVTGLPDIPFVTTALVQQCSDQSFPIAPPQVDCATKDQHPQTFFANVSRGRYYNQKFGQGKLHGVYVFGNDSKSARDSSFVSLGALRDIGIKSDKDFDLPGAAPQSAYTPVIQEMKNDGSNYGQAITANAMVLMRKEATLQGLTGVKVWDCGVGCYDKQNFLQAGGSDVEGQYVDTLYLPFYSKADQKANPMTGNYVKYTGTSNIASFGAYAWASGIVFRDAVNAAVKAHGINGVTRKTIFEELNKIHKFDADGMFAPIDLAGRKISNCSVTMQVKNGDFVRVSPTKPGTFKCWNNGIITRKLDIYGTGG
jgi:Periplasmic binding protein